MSGFPFGPPTNRQPVPGPKPVPGRPNWFYGPNAVPYYVEPPKPALNLMLTRSQKLAAAGFARRPTWRSLPDDE